MSQSYNIIASKMSRNSCGGIGKISLVSMDEKEIISIANEQANKCGYDLTQYSDIEWVGVNPDVDGNCEEFKLSREWNEGEELEAAIAEFTHNGHVYEIFKRGEQNAEFIARASDFDLEDEAIAFVE